MDVLDGFLRACDLFQDNFNAGPTAAQVSRATKRLLAELVDRGIFHDADRLLIHTPGGAVCVLVGDDLDDTSVRLSNGPGRPRTYSLEGDDRPEWEPRDSEWYVRKALEHDAFDVVRIDGRRRSGADCLYGLHVPLALNSACASFEESPSKLFCDVYDEAVNADDAVKLYEQRGGTVKLAVRHRGRSSDIVLASSIVHRRPVFSDKMFKALVAEEEARFRALKWDGASASTSTATMDRPSLVRAVRESLARAESDLDENARRVVGAHQPRIPDAFRSLHELGNGWRVERSAAHRAIELINDDLGVFILLPDNGWERLPEAGRRPRAEVIREKLAARKPKIACQGDYLEDWE